MPPRTDKTTLKQYFRSGSRPTQKQFHELVDNCYNGDIGSSVSGYQVLMDVENARTISSLRRESGKTYLIPFFDRINVVNGNKELTIRQSVNVSEIKIHNGAEEIYAISSGIKFEKSVFEAQLQREAAQWFGIGIDIAVAYDIKSDIAVSDKFNVAEQSEEMLLHTFGTVECFFIPGQ
jgi:hypothetical protein